MERCTVGRAAEHVDPDALVRVGEQSSPDLCGASLPWADEGVRSTRPRLLRVRFVSPSLVQGRDIASHWRSRYCGSSCPEVARHSVARHFLRRGQSDCIELAGSIHAWEMT